MSWEIVLWQCYFLLYIQHSLGRTDVTLRHVKGKITENTVYACALLSAHADTHGTKGKKGTISRMSDQANAKIDKFINEYLLEKKTSVHIKTLNLRLTLFSFLKEESYDNPIWYISCLQYQISQFVPKLENINQHTCNINAWLVGFFLIIYTL